MKRTRVPELQSSVLPSGGQSSVLPAEDNSRRDPCGASRHSYVGHLGTASWGVLAQPRDAFHYNHVVLLGAPVPWWSSRDPFPLVDIEVVIELASKRDEHRPMVLCVRPSRALLVQNWGEAATAGTTRFSVPLVLESAYVKFDLGGTWMIFLEHLKFCSWLC